MAAKHKNTCYHFLLYFPPPLAKTNQLATIAMSFYPQLSRGYEPYDLNIANWVLYDTLPQLPDMSQRPRSFRSLASTGKKHLMKDFITDQFERFRYKVDQPVDNGRDILLEEFRKLAQQTEYEEEKKTSRKLRYSLYFRKEPEQRGVMLFDLPADASVCDVVSRVRGGPIERVVPGTCPEPFLEVHFLHSKSADSFAKYARTGLFVVNGTKPVVSRRPFELVKIHPVEDYVMAAATKNKATRVIELLIPFKAPLATSSLGKYPKPSQWYVSGLDITDIRRDLVQFGSIVEVRPVIATECTISIQFMSIAELILAMLSFSLYGTYHHTKYRGWKVEYGKDPADVPCFNV